MFLGFVCQDNVEPESRGILPDGTPLILTLSESLTLSIGAMTAGCGLLEPLAGHDLHPAHGSPFPSYGKLFPLERTLAPTGMQIGVTPAVAHGASSKKAQHLGLTCSW